MADDDLPLGALLSLLPGTIQDRAEASLDLPAGATMQHSIFVVAYEHEGENRYGFSTNGEASLAQGLGLLEIVKTHMIGGA